MLAFALVLGVLFALSIIGGLVTLFVLWPRLNRLEREVTELRAAALAPARLERVAPAERVAPVAPAERVAPVAPAGPVVPVAPARPVAPVATSGAAAPAASPGPEVPPVTPVEAAGPEASWEVTVGSSWLNKIGVLVVIIGLALGLSYSFTRVGPAGRVAMGFAVSLAMLGGGLVVARREAFVAYGHGLVAGGWAGTYFTTYAMHGIEAARIVESGVVGTMALSAVSAAMFAHSLRYRSPIVTGLALVVVYATLATTPLTWFALTAAVPIAAAVLFVAARRDWTGMTALGIGATYALVSLHAATDRTGALAPSALAPYLLLAAYWLTFEAADLARLLRARAEASAATEVFSLNAIGLVGAALLVLPAGDTARLSVFMALMAGAYAASALLRRRAGIGAPSPAGEPTRFTTFHAAAIMASLLLAWSAGIRFDGIRLAVTWLVEAELLFAAGIVLADARLRAIGTAGVGLAMFHALGQADGPQRLAWPFDMAAATPLLLLVAGVIYLNRGWLRRLGDSAYTVERESTWAALGLVALAIWLEAPTTWTGFWWLVAGAVAIEAGLRRAPEYRWQGYTLALFGAWLTINVFGAGRTLDATAIWVALGGSSLLAWLVAARFALAAPPVARQERDVVAGVASVAGALLLAFFEWRALPADWFGPVLAATGYSLYVAGLATTRSLLRTEGYLLLAMGTARSYAAVIGGGMATSFQIWALVASVVLIYATTLTGRARLQDDQADIERIARVALTAFATLSAALLVVDEMRASLVTLTWGLIGLGLLVVGFPARERVLRLAGLAMLALCVLKLFVYDLSELEALPRIMSFVVLGLVLLGVSWVYTRVKGGVRS
jgi:uncharacterized membrane protein